MKRFVGMVLGAALVAAAPAQASFCGLFKGHKKQDAGCETVACAAPVAECAPVAAAPAPEVKWEQKEVTTYKCETKTRKVEVSVCKQVWKDVAYDYTVMEATQVKESRPVTTYKTVSEQVPCTYTTYEARTTTEKRNVTTWACVPRTVTTSVPVCTRVACAAPANDCCAPTNDCDNGGRKHGLFSSCFSRSRGHIGSDCGPSYTYQTTYRTVCKTVYDRVPTTTTVDCPVTRCVPVTHQGSRCVTKCVPETHNVDVWVTKCNAVVKHGTRKVCENVTEKKMVDQTYTEMVPHKEMVKVAVYPAPCATAAYSMSGDCGATTDCGHKKRGCFSKLFGGHDRSRSCNSGCN